MECFVNNILVPSPDRPRPELLASLPRLRARLEEQRRFRIDQLAMLGEPTPRRAGGWRPALAAEGDLDAEHDRIRAALAEGARRVLADIETALHRMRTGRYGTCQRCAGPIPLEQLHVIPYAARCVDCQRPATHR
jgi:DnaK suppressor protein